MFEYRLHIQTTQPHTFFFFIIFMKKTELFFHEAKAFWETKHKTLLKPRDPKLVTITETQSLYLLSLYSLISYSLFSHGWNSYHGDPIPFSLLSSQTRALSLLSLPIYLMTENPWLIIFSKSMVENPWPKPTLTEISSSLSLSLYPDQ